MEILNKTSLCDALVRCGDNINYKAIIVFATLADARNFAKELCEFHKNSAIPGVDRVFVSSIGGSRINFANGSRIEITVPTASNRAKRCNEIIYDDKVDITNDYIRTLLQRMLVPYRRGAKNIEGCPTTEEVAQYSEELDEFLGSFSITE